MRTRKSTVVTVAAVAVAIIGIGGGVAMANDSGGARSGSTPAVSPSGSGTHDVNDDHGRNGQGRDDAPGDDHNQGNHVEPGDDRGQHNEAGDDRGPNRGPGGPNQDDHGGPGRR